MLSTQTQSLSNYSFESPLGTNESRSILSTSKYPTSLQATAFSSTYFSGSRTIAFVDSNVSDAMSIMADLRADIKVLLDPTRDGISQITETLGNYKNLTGINIVSHGYAGGLKLGNSLLSANSLNQYSSQIQQWGTSLANDADIQLYGCNIAYGDLGQGFVRGLSVLTGADVAASTDLTGNSSEGGDWILEYATGSIETAIPFTTSFMNSYKGILASLFTTQTPVVTNATDGSGSAGDYELGMEFRSSKPGTIDAIRYYKAASETGTHTGRIWSAATGQQLATVTFTNETGSGWQQQTLDTPLDIQANTTYIVSVNANTHYVATSNGLATTLTNGDLSAVADGSNGVYNTTPGSLPIQSFNNANYFRDIVFTPNAPVNNTPGSVNVTGTATQNQALTANVADADGLTGVTINYQWQQSSNGTTWTNITGATNQTLSLAQAQVGNRVRVTANYTDALGSSESLTSTASGVVANVNDPGALTVNGITSQGNTLTANVADPDGLPSTIAYQWQQSSNGTTWTNISGATTQTLSLTNSFVGQQVRVNAIYTDVLGANESILSNPTPIISATAQTQSLFTTQTPVVTNATDGSGSAGDYELGMEFRSSKPGTIDAIRYYKAASETGTHTGRIWSAATGQQLATVTFTNETGSGWQQQTLDTPLDIQANTTYIVSVNANTHYVATSNGLATTLTNGDLSAVADGSNGVYNTTPGSLPIQSFNNANYFRDIVFTPNAPVNNTPGSVNVTGTATQNQALTANVADADGLTGVTINYQWQQSSNGTTWTNITGATNQTLSLAQAQVGNRVRVTANYTDALGSSESLTSTASGVVANVNDPGTLAISGVAAQGNTLTANVADPDGLPSTIAYQWQQSSNGTTWTNISGATNRTLVLDSNLVGRQVRVNAIYADVLGANENVTSAGTASIGVPADTSLYTMSVFAPMTYTPSVTPSTINFTDGAGSAGDYELGMQFSSTTAGQINAVRYYKAPSETGTHVGRIWSNTGELLATVNFTNETASGWQQQALDAPLTIQANTTYVVSVNVNSYYSLTPSGLSTPRTTQSLTGIRGVFNDNPGAFPGQVFQNENYFRDIVFTPAAPPPTNSSGGVTLSGTPVENQTLSATLNDANGLPSSNISYQWQQMENAIWTNISGATKSTLKLGDAQVGKTLRLKVAYTDNQGNREYLVSSMTAAVANVNDQGAAILKGSATTGETLTATILDDDGLTGSNISYQWQQFVNNIWTNISGATTRTLTLGASLLGSQVRATASYIDALGTSENISSSGTAIAAQNAIVVENQKPGTRDWEITNLATSNQIAGYASATSVNQGETLPIKVSLAQAGQYRIDVYRLGYYGGAGGRFMGTSGVLNGGPQAGPTTNQATRLVEYNWNTSYELAIGNDWTSGLYVAKLTSLGAGGSTGPQTHVSFVVRDDDRPADLGFQAAFTTYEAYNNYGGYSTYNNNSQNAQRAFAVSFNRPMAQTVEVSEVSNNMLTWEYNMARWLESQGYDVSYYTNLDVHSNSRQLYSQDTFLSVGHDEYWSMEMFDNITKARDSGINLAFFSANTAYWRVRFEPSSTGEENRTMVVYKQDWASDPAVIAGDISAATTVFRSPELNRPENGLMGVMYVGDSGTNSIYDGFNYVVTDSSDPYFANTGLQNGDVLRGIVGYEWDAVVNNGATPAGLVSLAQANTLYAGGLPSLPPGTNPNIANAARYTAASGAKVFSSGTIQWMWGLDSDRVRGLGDRTDIRIQQITTNILADMDADPETPSNGIVVPT
jgi:hypothetical protein